jgi:hypothetical protein
MTTTTMTIDMDNSFVFATKYMKWMVSHDGTNVAEHTSSVEARNTSNVKEEYSQGCMNMKRNNICKGSIPAYGL